MTIYQEITMDLQTLRSKITETDEQLLQLLATRQQLSKSVPKTKSDITKMYVTLIGKRNSW